MEPQHQVDRPASESGSVVAARVPPSTTSPRLGEGRRVASQPATILFPNRN